MTIKELSKFIEEHHLFPSDDVESLIIRLIYQDKIINYECVVNAILGNLQYHANKNYKNE